MMRSARAARAARLARRLPPRALSSDAASDAGVPLFGTLHELSELSLSYGDRPSLGTREPDGTWRWVSYAERYALTQRTRAALSARGLKSGDRVAVVSKNREEWVYAAYAAYGLGAIHVPMYEQQSPKEWDYIVVRARPRRGSARRAAECWGRGVTRATTTAVVLAPCARRT